MHSSTARLLPGRRWAMSFALVLWSASGLAAAVLLWRRTAGAFSNELPLPASGLLVLATLGLTLLAYLLGQRIIAQPSGPGLNATSSEEPPVGRWPLRTWGAAVASVVPPLILCAALLPPRTVPAVLFFACSLLIACLGIALVTKVGQTASRLCSDTPWSPRHSSRVAAAKPDRPQPQQQLSRFVLPGGGERVEAVLQTIFAPGQSQTAAHLPLSPPLAGPPQVACQVLENPAVRARVTLAKPYGVRIEVKREGDISGPVAVTLRVDVTVPSAT